MAETEAELSGDPFRTPRSPRGVLHAWKWTIAGTTALGLLAALLFSLLQTPTYDSKSAVLVQGEGPPQGPNMATEKRLARSVPVANLAAQQLETAVDPEKLLEDLSVTVPPETEIIEFRYRDSDASRAQAAAQAFAEAYVQYRQDLPGEAVFLGRIIEPASRPRAPSRPNYPINLAFGAFLGLSLGVGTALLMEQLDDRVRDVADLEATLGVPVLGAVPRRAPWRRRREGAPATLGEPPPAESETYQEIRANVLAATSGLEGCVLLIASCCGQEANTAVTANLGAALARTGRSVVLVPGNLGNHGLHQFFGVDHRDGATDVLTDQSDLSSALRSAGIPNLQLLSAKPKGDQPPDWLSAPSMLDLMKALKEHAEFVLIDAGPALAIVEARALLPFARVVIVADTRSSTRSSIRGLRRELARAHASVMGCVIADL